MAAPGDPNDHPCAPPVIGAIELPTHAVVVATNSEQAESKRAIELHLMVTLLIALKWGETSVDGVAGVKPWYVRTSSFGDGAVAGSSSAVQKKRLAS
jgi:hypothetical protein